MLTIAACLWDANARTQSFSKCYDETWVEKLYRGFQRNLTRPFEFVLFTDKPRRFSEPIRLEPLVTPQPHYGCLIEPFRLGVPSIVCGLDLVVLRNIDHMADYTMWGKKVAVPRDPYKPEQCINPLALVPAGHEQIFTEWRGENDMEWLRKQETVPLDGIFPGAAVSLKAHRIRATGPGDACIVYMHGEPKAHQLLHLDWIREHWR